MNRTKYIIGNWKENPENLETANKLIEITEEFNSLGKPFAVTHAVPSIFAGYLKHAKAEIILQDISCFEGGSYTGQISAKQAMSLGIGMSIVGHSETRLSPKNTKGDEDVQVNTKLKNLIKENMLACLCIGEYTRKDSDYKLFLKTQIENCLKDIPDVSKVIFAYEPVWAIGKDAERPATNEEISETISYIKEILQPNSQVLYGGSVDENNAKEIVNLEVVDGLLIGRASSDPEKWQKLLQNLQ